LRNRQTKAETGQPSTVKTPVVLSIPPYREKEKTDNDRLMNLQYKYLTGDKKALSDLYVLSCQVCTKFIMDQRRKKGFFLQDEDIEEKAHCAALYLITQYLIRPDFIRQSNITAYLFMRVLHELYYHTKIDEIVDFVDFSERQDPEQDDDTDDGEESAMDNE
jgi:hypothetical protein